MRVLVVEDDLLYQQAIRKAFDKAHLKIVHISSNCKDAKEYAGKFDAAVVDISLGDGNGLDLVEDHLKQFQKPIIFYSDTTYEKYVERARALGAALCSKNSSINQLVAQVKKSQIIG